MTPPFTPFTTPCTPLTTPPRSLGLENIEMSCSLAHNGIGSLLDLNDMSLSEGTRAEVERALTSAQPLAASP